MSNDNVTNVCRRFLQIHDKEFDSTVVERHIHFHSDKFSMKAISDTLKYHGVVNLVVSLSKAHLRDIPLPAIFHSEVKEQHVFRCLTKIETDCVSYYENSYKEDKRSICDFIREWTGVVLIGECTDCTFSQVLNKEISPKTIKHSMLAFLLVICSASFQKCNSYGDVIAAVLSLWG